MHVAQISFFLDPQRRQPARLLEDWPSLVDVASAVTAAGAQVSVIQACCRSEIVVRGGVAYHFLAPDPGASTIASSRRFDALIRRVAPDVLHVHGFGFPRDVLTLARIAAGIPMMLQDHANRPPRPWRRPLWRLQFATVAGLAITGTAKLETFRSVKLLPAGLAVFDIPESTSRFVPGERAEARRRTGLHGEPALLWVGHMNQNKDPLTVLNGVSVAARKLSGLELWCCFGSAPLRSAVERRLSRDPLLSARVHLLGPVTHPEIEQLMRAADLFVTGSHAEGSGYAVLEALACGLPVAITDIPAFRSLLGSDGAVGRLWPCDNAARLADAIVELASRPQPVLRRAVRAHFDRELSLEAVGRKLTAAYGQLLAARGDATAAGHRTSSALNA